jgi:hypothetical protein
MIIQSVTVKRFRSIFDETLQCEPLTALVGPNGAGKSTFLRALDLFYARSPNISLNDFFNKSSEENLEIEVTYSDLSEKEVELFSNYMDGGTLSVARIFYPNGGKSNGKYFGMRLQNPDFKIVRGSGGKSDIRSAYGALRIDNDTYNELPTVRSADEAVAAMATWESSHQENCEMSRDDGQFFGFTNVGAGNLRAWTDFVFVPAVRDAADESADSRDSAISQLMNMIVRSVVESREDIKKFHDKASADFAALTSPENLPELHQLSNSLSETLQTYYPSAGVNLDWADTGNIDISFPKAKVELEEGGFVAPVSQTGHGLQRAFIFSLLQRLAAATTARDANNPPLESETIAEESDASDTSEQINSSGLILAIEEPELFQHPGRQRHFSRVLFELASGEILGVAGRTQVLYATHSPLLIDIDRYEQIRIVRKEPSEDISLPQKSTVTYTSWEDVRDEFESVLKKPRAFSALSTRSKYHVMNPFLNEGFFSDRVVLVEGGGDRAAILATADLMDINLEGSDTSVLPCDGKTKIGVPAVIFKKLSVPIYLLWDNDRDSTDHKNNTSIEWNRNYQLLMGIDNPVDWPNSVEKNFACLEKNLEVVLKTEFGDEFFRERMIEQADLLDIPPKRVSKNSEGMRNIIIAAGKAGKISKTLRSAIEQIQAL